MPVPLSGRKGSTRIDDQQCGSSRLGGGAHCRRSGRRRPPTYSFLKAISRTVFCYHFLVPRNRRYFYESNCVKERSFRHKSRCISDAHSSKTKAVVWALAICVCSLLAAGATQTASAQTTILKTAHRGLEVGAFQTPAEIDCQNRSSAENGCSDETFCA